MSLLPFVLSKQVYFFWIFGVSHMYYIMLWIIHGISLEQRQAAQCVGRVIRSKADYGMMIFADKRFVLSYPYISLRILVT